MSNFHIIALFTQMLIQLIGNKHATMLAAGAANADNKLRLALIDILRHKKIKQLLLKL